MSAGQPLLLAAASGAVDSVRRLLADGADTRQTDGRGWTALHHAAFKNRPDVINCLAKHPGTVVDAQDSSGDTPLAVAALTRRTQAAWALLKAGAASQRVTDPQDQQFIAQVEEDMQAAALNEDAAAATAPGPKRGPAASDPDSKPLTPAAATDARLLHACANADVAGVRRALKQGASPRAWDARGWTAMHHAAFGGDPQVIHALLQAGAAADAASRSGETPISVAALLRRGAVCQTLLEAGMPIHGVTDPSDKAYLVSLYGNDKDGPEGSVYSAIAAYGIKTAWDTCSSTGDGEREEIGVGSLVKYPQPATLGTTSGTTARRQSGTPVDRVGVVLEVLLPEGDGNGPVDPDAPAIGPLVVRDLAAGSVLRMHADQVKPIKGYEAEDLLAANKLPVMETQELKTSNPNDETDKPTSRGMPHRSRRATPMYVAIGTGAHTTGLDPKASYPSCAGSGASSCDMPAGDGSKWELIALPIRSGAHIGLLVDPATRLVYFQAPTAPTAASARPVAGRAGSNASSGGYSQDSFDETLSGAKKAAAGNHKASTSAANRVRPALPELVGRLRGSLKGVVPGREAAVVALTLEDVVTVEKCKHALRSLRRNNHVAALLMGAVRKAAKPGLATKGLLADLCPELSAPPYCEAVSLAVPLCCILGIAQVHELQDLHPQDLKECSVDEIFLPALKKLGRSTPLNYPLAQTGNPGIPALRASLDSATAAPTPGLATSMMRRSMVVDAEKHSGKWTPPSLVDLLKQHGLIKLLPLAANLGLLDRRACGRWSELVTHCVDEVPLHSAELRRLRELKRAIVVTLEKHTIMKASRKMKLSRVGEGSLVLYDSTSSRAELSGGRLVGVVIKVHAPDSATTSSAGYTVRDILDDSQATVTCGQLSHISRAQAGQYLRSDLLPPATLGVPVTPVSAAPGLLVQLVPGWISTEPGAAGADPALISKLIIGKLIKADEHVEDSWVVRWSDGSESSHPVGEGGKFALAHLHMHRLAGAPLLARHLHVNQASATAVVRSPTWPMETTDDIVPGSIGLARMSSPPPPTTATDGTSKPKAEVTFDESKQTSKGGRDKKDVQKTPQADQQVKEPAAVVAAKEVEPAVGVVWSRGRDRAEQTKTYTADDMGVFPLCHGLLQNQPITCYTAKPNVLVEPSDNQLGENLADMAAAGPGTLTRPMSWSWRDIKDDGPNSPCGVVWEVTWPNGATTQCTIPASLSSLSPLKVSSRQMLLPGEGAVALNEVAVGSATRVGGPMGGGAVKAVQTTASDTSKRYQDTAGAALPADLGLLGRQLFQRPHAMAPRAGMLGIFVKLNREAALLQPYCYDGPMKAYAPRTPAEVCHAQLVNGPPVPLDDVGWVVRDAGAGQWRGLLVRVLGTTQAFWYDEGALLPASQSDIQKKANRHAQSTTSFVLPLHQHGVPVTDANSAPGMLVKRAYMTSDVHDGMDKASMVGELIAPAGEHCWMVEWRDGIRGRYRTGARGRFQLCHVNLHDDAGAPVMAASVSELSASGVKDLPVMDGVHNCVRIGKGPGEVRTISLAAQTKVQEGLIRDDALALDFMGGGAMSLFELSYGIRPQDPVTVFNAKPGLRVMRATEKPQHGTSPTANTIQSRGVKVGILVKPVRLGMQARLKKKDETGQPIEWLNASECWWDVAWEDGLITQMPVGMLPDQTPLRVAFGGGIRSTASVSRAILVAERAIKKLAKDCQQLIKGRQDLDSLSLQDRLLAMVAQIQLQTTQTSYTNMLESSGGSVDEAEEAEENRSTSGGAVSQVDNDDNETQASHDATDEDDEDDDDDDDDEDEPEDDSDDDDEYLKQHDWKGYLERVEGAKNDLEKFHVAKQAVLLTQNTLSEVGTACWAGQAAEDGQAKLEELSKLAAQASRLLVARLPKAIKKIIKATMQMSNKSCKWMLEGIIEERVSTAPKFRPGDDKEEPSETEVKASESKLDDVEAVRQSAIALDICTRKLQEIQAMIPEDSFYAKALSDNINRARGQVALAGAAVAADWAGALCIPLNHLIDEENIEYKGRARSQQMDPVLAQVISAVNMCGKLQSQAEPGSAITPQDGYAPSRRNQQQELEEQEEDEGPQMNANMTFADFQKMVEEAEKAKEEKKAAEEKVKQAAMPAEIKPAGAADTGTKPTVSADAQAADNNETPAGTKLAGAAGDGPDIEKPAEEAQGSAAAAPAAESPPVQVEKKTAMGIPEVEQSLQSTMTYVVNMLHQASDSIGKKLGAVLDSTATMQDLQMGLAELGISDLLASQATTIQSVLEQAIPDAAQQAKATALCQAMRRTAEKARERVRAWAEAIASRHIANGHVAETVDSVMCHVFSSLESVEKSPRLAGKWAALALSRWPGVMQGFDRALDKVVQAEQVALIREAEAMEIAQAAKLKVDSSEQVALAKAKAEATEANDALALAQRLRKEVQAVRNSKEEELRRWLATQAAVVCKSVVAEWVGKRMADITLDTYLVNDDDALEYFGLELMRQRTAMNSSGRDNLNKNLIVSSRTSTLPATSNASSSGLSFFPNKPLYPTDQTMVTLYSLLEPLGMSAQLIDHVKEPERTQLDDAYNEVFQVASGAVYSRLTGTERFGRSVAQLKRQLKDKLSDSNQQGNKGQCDDDDEDDGHSYTSDDDSKKKKSRPKTPAALVACAYGYAYIGHVTHAVAGSILEQVPQVIPKRTWAEKLETGGSKAVKLFKAAEAMEKLLDEKNPGAFHQYTTRTLEDTIATANRLEAAVSASASAGLMPAGSMGHRRISHRLQPVPVALESVRGEDGEGTRLVLRPVMKNAHDAGVAEAIGSEDIQRLMEPCQALVRQMAAAHKQLDEAAGTTWNASTLRLKQTLQEVEKAWQMNVAHAMARLPPLYLW